MKSVQKLPKSSSSVDEMESCSKHVLGWPRYWAMAVSRDGSGKINDEVQGEAFEEDDVEHLLAGEWHLVDWIRLVHMLEKSTDNVQPDPSDHLGKFYTTCFECERVKSNVGSGGMCQR